MRAQPHSAVSYYHMLQWTCGGFFPAYSLQADNLALVISVGNVMSRWICPLNWYFRQKRLIYVYLIIGDTFLSLIFFGWFPMYPHIHKIKDKKFFGCCISCILVAWLVGWRGFFAKYIGTANIYQTDSIWNWNFLYSPGKNIPQALTVLAAPRPHQ